MPQQLNRVGNQNSIVHSIVPSIVHGLTQPSLLQTSEERARQQTQADVAPGPLPVMVDARTEQEDRADVLAWISRFGRDPLRPLPRPTTTSQGE